MLVVWLVLQACRESSMRQAMASPLQQLPGALPRPAGHLHPQLLFGQLLLMPGGQGGTAGHLVQQLQLLLNLFQHLLLLDLLQYLRLLLLDPLLQLLLDRPLQLLLLDLLQLLHRLLTTVSHSKLS